MAAGSIIVDLLMKTGSFVTDAARAEQALRSFKKEATDVADVVNLENSISLLKNGFIALTGVASVGAFGAIIGGAIEAKARLHDMSLTTGISVEALSALGKVGKFTQTPLDEIAQASVKLSKALFTANEDSKGAAQGLEALGLNIEEIKRLRAEEQMLAIAKALDQFADTGEKAAVANLIISKTGAQLLPFFKDLAEKTTLVGKQTTESAEQARQFEKNLITLKSVGEGWANSIATAALPRLVELTNQLVEASKKGELFGFSLSKLGEFFSGKLSLSVVAADAKSIQEQIDALQKSLAKNPGDTGIKKLIEELQTALALRQKAEAPKAGQAVFEEGFTLTKPKLKAPPGEDTKKKISEAQRFIDSLLKQIEVTGKATEFEKALAEVQSGRIKFTKDETAGILAAAGELDELVANLKAEEFERKSLENAIQDELKARIATLDAASQQAKKIEEENAALQDEIANVLAGEKAHYALQKARISSAIAAAKSKLAALDERDANLGTTQAIQEQIDALEKRLRLLNDREGADNFIKQTQEMEKATEDARQTFEQTLGQGLQDALDGNFKSIGDLFVKLVKRMAAEALAADLTDKLFGRSSTRGPGLLEGFAALAGNLFGGGSLTPTGGSISGTYLPDVLRGGRANGGPVSPGGPYMVGERGPELFVPNTAGRIVPNGAWGGGGGINITVHNAPAGTSVERTQARQGPNGREVEVWLAQRIASGQSPVNSALKARGVSMSGALPVRPV